MLWHVITQLLHAVALETARIPLTHHLKIVQSFSSHHDDNLFAQLVLRKQTTKTTSDTQRYYQTWRQYICSEVMLLLAHNAPCASSLQTYITYYLTGDKT